jgi:hypothetical protein
MSAILHFLEVATTLAVWVGLCVALSLAITGVAIWVRGKG